MKLLRRITSFEAIARIIAIQAFVAIPSSSYIILEYKTITLVVFTITLDPFYEFEYGSDYIEYHIH